jgi:hypothetical protein
MKLIKYIFYRIKLFIQQVKLDEDGNEWTIEQWSA